MVNVAVVGGGGRPFHPAHFRRKPVAFAAAEKNVGGRGKLTSLMREESALRPG